MFVVGTPVARSHPYHRILRSTPYLLPAHQFHFHGATGSRSAVDWLSERNTDSPCSIVHGHGMGNFRLEVVSVPLRVLPGPGTPHFHSSSSIQNLHIGHPWPLEPLVTLNGKTGYYRSSLDRINIGLLGNDHPPPLGPCITRTNADEKASPLHALRWPRQCNVVQHRPRAFRCQLLSVPY